MKTSSLIVAMLPFMLLFACNTTEPERVDPEKSGSVIFLNNGNWNSNDACICLYDIESGSLSEDVFGAANARRLGDLAQDIAVFADDIIVTMNGSQLVYVLDREFKVKKEIIAEKDGTRLSPRCLATSSDRVYVTYYEGFLGELRPSEGYVLRLTQVGPNPDGLACSGGRIYVANSGGYLSPTYGNTVSVVDADSFAEVATVDVNCNPVSVVASGDGTFVYVCSWGNYADKDSALERIDARTLEVSRLPYENVRGIAGCGDCLYVATGSYDADWRISGRVNKYDMKSGCPSGMLSDMSVPSYYSISADPHGYVFVGSSDYTTEGDVYVFDQDGDFVAKTGSGGLNPLKGVCL